MEKYFVPDEHECFSQVKTNPIEHSDFILENFTWELLMLEMYVIFQVQEWLVFHGGEFCI